ncbi:radical SAM protein [Candidatus Sumerlaeota bacterium]|nr:radical SAM protein [Candidatus Sumerlaeota bacterium]
MNVLFLYFELRKEIVDSNLLEIGISSALLKQNNHSVSMLYLKTIPGPDELAEYLKKYSPHLIVPFLDYDQLSFISPLLEQVKGFCSTAIVCCVGPLCTAMPDTVIAHPSVEMIIGGEFEIALLEVAEALERNKGLRNIRNTWLKEAKEIAKTPLREPISKLDALPYADRTIYDHNQLVEYREGRVVVSASRGCPYKCEFCSVTPLSSVYQTKGVFYRVRSPLHIVGEIKKIAKTVKIDRVVFCDEEFPLDIDWLKEFREKYTTFSPYPFSITASVERLSLPGVIDILKESGCEEVRLGVETGNQTFRRRVAGRNLSNEQILRLATKLREREIKISTTNMVGLPLETPELTQETLELNKKLKPDKIYVKTYYPAPGTSLYQYCRQKGYIKSMELPPRPYESVLALPFMTPEDIKKAYERLHLLDCVIRSRRWRENAVGYFDFAAAFENAIIDADSSAEVSLEEVTIDEKRLPAICQNPGTKVIFDCDIRSPGFLQVFVGVKKIPVGDFITFSPLTFTIELHRRGKKDVLFQRVLKPNEDTNRSWRKYYVPLFDIHPGKGRLVFSISANTSLNSGYIYGVWGVPALTDKLLEADGKFEIIKEKDLEGERTLREKLEEKEEMCTRLKRQLQELEGQHSKLQQDFDTLKRRITQLQLELMEKDKAIGIYRKSIEELEKIREAYESSLSTRMKKFIKKKTSKK